MTAILGLVRFLSVGANQPAEARSLWRCLRQAGFL